MNVWLAAKLRTPSTNFTRYIETTIGGRPALANIRDIDGKVVTLPRENLVLYFFSPTCKWCERNLTSFKIMNAQLSSRYSFVGVVSDSKGVAEYLRLNPLPFPTVVVDDASDTSSLGLRGTPQTIVLQNGVVVHNWPGAYLGDTKSSIEKSLRVTLPEVIVPH